MTLRIPCDSFFLPPYCRHCLQGANPNTHLDRNGAAVHLAAKTPRMLAELLNLGGDVNLKAAATGNTPLHIAAQHGKTACVRICLANGANFKIRNHLGVTPRDVVRRRSRAKRWWAPVDSAYYLDNLERINESMLANGIATVQQQEEARERERQRRHHEHNHHHHHHHHHGAGAAAAAAWRSQDIDHNSTPERRAVPSQPRTSTSTDSRCQTGGSNSSLDTASPCSAIPQNSLRNSLSISKLPGVMAEMFDCSVCLDVMDDPVTLPCGHTCCRGCIELMKHHSEHDFFECPLDRARIPRGFPLRTSVILKQIRHVLSTVGCSSDAGKLVSPQCTSMTPVLPASG